jgi:hypothetical protein
LPILADFFYRDNVSTPVPDIAIARQFQEYLRRFITGGENKIEFPTLPDWPAYGSKEIVYNVTLNGFEKQRDYWEVNRRSQVLNKIFADRRNGI